jgi:hypothetical protein
MIINQKERNKILENFELLQDVVQDLDNSELQELIALAEKELTLSEISIKEGMEVRR